MSDSQIDELTVRHEIEKNKASMIQIDHSESPQQVVQQKPREQEYNQKPQIQNSGLTRNMGLLKKGRQPLNLNSSRDLLAKDEDTPFESRKVVEFNEEYHIHSGNGHTNAQNLNEDDDGDMNRLLERHMSEKNKIIEFQEPTHIQDHNIIRENNQTSTNDIKVE